ncbi:MAG: hypothetical protein LUD27_02935, partial [Clostridia bacterium]|nr:hypothetical protein [Clostridia bacterium]
SVSEDQLIPSDYYSRGDLYVEYYSGYGLVEINFHSEDGYSFLVTYDEDSEVYTDNYEFSYTYTGDVSNVSLSSSGSGTTEVSSKYCYLTLRDAFGGTDWNITIHLTCYEDVSE